MTIGLSSAILEKGSHWITWHLGKRAVHQVRQTGEGKGEEKVCGSLRGRCQAFIDAMGVLRWHVTSLKAV